MAKRFSITLSDDLHKAAFLLLKARKYRSITEYIAALIRYDGQSQREHHLTSEWAALDGYERDRLDHAILRQVRSGKGVRGSWLEARIAEIVKKHLAEGHTPNKKEVAAELARELGDPDAA